MDHTIDWYMGLMEELDEEFDPLVSMFDAIDDMVLPRWNLPAEFTNVVKDVMAVIDTGPSDAINSAAISFSRNIPTFSVMPFRANKAEYDRAQSLEDNLRYQFKRSNKRGNGSVMYDMADSSLRYNTVAIRTDDLAHILPKDKSKWTPAQKIAWSNGRFIHNVYNPKGIRYLYSSQGLTFVGNTEILRARDCLSHWKLYANNDTDEGRMAAQAVADLEKAISDNKDNFAENDLYVTQTYAIDYDKLCVWGSLTNENTDEITREGRTYQFIFADQKNPYGFIPWSIRVAGSRLEKKIEYRVNPLLAPLYWAKSWDKINLFKSVVFSEPFRRARTPRIKTMTQSGEPPMIDYENGGDMNLRVGEDAQPFVPITLDQSALAIVQAMESSMNRTTGASVIGDTTKIDSRTPFATFAAMVKVALSRLDKQNEIMSDAVRDVACNMLWWVDKTDIPLVSYVESQTNYKSGTQMQRGQNIETGKYDFDLNDLGISCKVIPSTPTDRMEQLNMAILLSEKLNMPSSELLQEMGYDNVGLSYQIWTEEFMKKSELQAQAAGLVAKYQAMGQLEAQQMAQQQQQAQQQPPPEQGGGPSNAAFGNMGGSQGFNPAMGGTPPAMGAPTQTREAITGQPMNGNGVQ